VTLDEEAYFVKLDEAEYPARYHCRDAIVLRVSTSVRHKQVNYLLRASSHSYGLCIKEFTVLAYKYAKRSRIL